MIRWCAYCQHLIGEIPPVSLVETIPAAANFARRLAEILPRGSELALGGQAFRHGESSEFPADVPVLLTIARYIDRLERLANTTWRQDSEPKAVT